MKKHDYALMMGLTEEAVDNWDNGSLDYNCDWCNAPTPNGAGHFQEEMGYDHTQGEDRICTACYTQWKANS